MEGLERALEDADALLFERLGDDARYVRWVLPFVIVEGTIAELRLRLEDDAPPDVCARVQPRLPAVAAEATELVRERMAHFEAPTEQVRLTPEMIQAATKKTEDDR